MDIFGTVDFKIKVLKKTKDTDWLMLNFSNKLYVFNPKRFSIDFIEISLVYGKFKLITNWKV